MSRDRGISHQIFNACTEHLDLLYIKKDYGVYNNDNNETFAAYLIMHISLFPIIILPHEASLLKLPILQSIS